MRCEVCRSPIDSDRKICDRCAAKYKGIAPASAPSPSGAASGPGSPERRARGPRPENKPSDPVVFPDSSYAAVKGVARADAPAIMRPVGGGPVQDPRRSVAMLDAAEPKAIPTGTVLEGKYELIEEIGRGSMGTVFLATDIALQRKVAVKFLLPELIAAPESADRFRREAVAMAAIRDQNVAQIFTYGEQDRRPYFVMEYLPGRTVESLIDTHNQAGEFVPLATALDVIWQVIGGLGEIHRSGAVHRDIKPANIMLTGDPTRAVILDFGLVRDVRIEDDMLTLAGTPAYIAPELVEGKGGADRSPLVDIYSAGTTAYEIVTGTIPFTGESWLEILDKHVRETPLPPSERRPGLPPLLDDIILTAMAKDPADRYPTAEDFLKSLMLIDGQQAASTESQPARARRVSHTPVDLTRESVQSQAHPRVLVMDADPEFRGLVSGTAGAAVPGCQVLAAADAQTAMRILAQSPPRVALLDVALPDVVGMEVAAAIRADESFDGVEIVGVATADEAPDDEALKWLSLSHFLTKPVDVGQLADLLCTLCAAQP